ncbi:S-layer homology domain-containing protein [Paenibacillus sp. GCM10023248]|uniref:S-layer homology domain-containing protein n=1 Tax=unclassified Paenibacillus TaxID=185978 RepID=UPI00237984ED|nr:S-layer homology domain-containing protein [Paenibacillus sp. MAHUQ-63]MDD9271649.1 S-layer homology domain-containing protein [Paenibacillus sp. MAHUQ-63]
MRRWVAVLLNMSLLFGLFPVPVPAAAAITDPPVSSPRYAKEQHTVKVGDLIALSTEETAVTKQVYDLGPIKAAAVPELAQPVINPLPAKTNQNEVQITGTAPLDAEVTIKYGLIENGMPDTEETAVASEVYGPGLGRFAMTLHLAEAGVYQVRAIAKREEQTSAETDPVRIELDQLPPYGRWMNLRSVGSTDSQIELQWDPITGETIDYYQLQWKDGESWSVLKETKDDLRFVHTGLPEEAFQQYRLFAFDEAGNASDGLLFFGSTFHSDAKEIANTSPAERHRGFWDAVMSKDGSTAAFISNSNELPGYDPENPDVERVYVYDTASGSLTNIGHLGNRYRQGEMIALSATGRYAAFETWDEGEEVNVLEVYDRTLDRHERVVTTGEGHFAHLSMSEDGSKLAFVSEAGNLVAGDTNGRLDVFLVDRSGESGGTVKRISSPEGKPETTADSEEVALSGDGRYAAFVSRAPELVPDGGAGDGKNKLFVYDTLLGQLHYQNIRQPGSDTEVTSPSLTADGRYMAIRYADYRGVEIAVLERAGTAWSKKWQWSTAASSVDLGAPHLTADGNYIYFRYENYDSLNMQAPYLQWATIRFDLADTSMYRYIGKLSADNGSISLSGDGKRGVFTEEYGGESFGTNRVFTVCLDDCSTTPPPSKDTVKRADVTIPQLVHGQAPIGSVLSIRASADAGKNLQAVIAYELDGDASIHEDTVALSLSPSNPQVYIGSYKLQEETVRVASVRVQPKGSPEAAKAASGFPVEVAGELNVKLVTDHPGHLRGSQVTVWSESRNTGRSAAFGEALEASVALAAADDYTVQITDAAGRKLLERRGVALKRAERTSIAETVSPLAEFTLHVRGSRNEEMPGVTVHFQDADGKPNYSGKTDASGAIRLRGVHSAGETIRVKLETQPPYETPEVITVTLEPGRNERTVQLNDLTDGILQGVTFGGGKAVPGAHVSIVSVSENNSTSVELVSDANGKFTFRGSPGTYVINAKRKAAPMYHNEQPQRVTLVSGETTELVVPLVNRGIGTLAIRGWLKPVDGDYGPIDVSDWRAAVHYRLTVSSKSSGMQSSQGMLWNNGGGLAAGSVKVYGASGEGFEVCLNGSEAGLTTNCTTAVLDDEWNAVAEVKLEEKARIEGAVLDLADASQYQVTAGYKEDGKSTAIYNAMVETDGHFSVSLPKAGKYELAITKRTPIGYYGGSPTYRIVTQVAEGQKLVLPPVAIPKGEVIFTGDPNNGFAVTELTVSTGQSVTLQARYMLPGAKPAVTDAALLLTVPEGTELLSDSVVLNGTTIVPGAVEGGTYRIPLGNLKPGNKGTLNYRLQVGQPADSKVEAGIAMEYRKTADASLTVEPLGSTYIHVAPVTLEVPSRTQGLEIPVSGRAPAGKEVLIFANDELIGRTVATPGGLWFTRVTLPSMESPGIWSDSAQYYRVTAKSEIDGAYIQSEARQVTADRSLPAVTEVVLRQPDGREVTFDPSKGVSRFPYVVVPSKPLLLQVKLANPERAENVRIRVGNTEVAATPAGAGLYTASLPVSSNGLGSGIYVKYNTAPAAPSPRPVPPTTAEWQAARQQLADTWRNAEFSIADESREGPDGDTVYTPTYRAVLGDKNRTAMNLRVSMKAVKITDSGTAKPYRDFTYGLNPNDLTFRISGNVALSAISQQDAEQLRAMFPQTLGGDTISTDYVTIALSLAFPEAKKANEVLGILGTLKSLLSDAGDSMTFADQLLEFQDYVINNECNLPTVNYYMRRINLLYDHAANGLLGKNLLTGIGGVVGVIDKIPNKVGNSIAAVLTALGDGILASWQADLNELKEEFEKEKKWRDDMAEAGAIERCNKKKDDDDDEDKVPPPKKPDKPDKVADPIWIWDPSGYVYEALPENRIGGVTATVLQQDSSSPEVWREWDAGWFGQSNPLTTDKLGRYGWDVPEGKWRVMFEKEGYLPAQSADLTVLPPHFDVNVGMISLAPPTASVGQVVYGSGIPLSFSKYMVADTVNDLSVYAETEDGFRVAGHVEAVDPKPDAAEVALTKQFTFIPDAPLAEGAVYRLHIMADVQSYARVGMNEEQSFTLTVQPSTASPLEAVSAVNITGGSRQLLAEWAEDDTVDYDHVHLTASPLGSTCAAVDINVPRGSGNAVIGALCPNTAYELRVATVGRNGVESIGVVSSGTTLAEMELVLDTTAPQEAGEIAAAASTDSLTVTWRDPADADLHQVLVAWKKKGEARYSPVTYVDRGVQSWRIDGLEPATDYEIRLLTADSYRNTSNGATVQAATKNGGGGSPGPGPGTGSGGASGGGSAPVPAKEETAELELTGHSQEWSGFEGRVRVSIPDGAFLPGRKLTAIRVLVSAASESGYKPIGDSVVFTTDDKTNPSKPLRLSMAAGLTEDSAMDLRRLGIYKRDSAAAAGWTYIGGVADLANRRIEADIAALGEYAIFLYDRAFTDLEEHWSLPDVSVLVSRHIVNGTDAGHFQPDRPITRAETAKLLLEALGPVERHASRTASRISDVADEAWYAAYVARAAEIGLVEGADGQFRPNDAVSREELAVLFQRFTELRGLKPADAPAPDALDAFADAGAISGWAKDAMAAAVARGWLQGMSAAHIAPASPATRAQTAVMLLRVLAQAGDIVK